MPRRSTAKGKPAKGTASKSAKNKAAKAAKPAKKPTARGTRSARDTRKKGGARTAGARMRRATRARMPQELASQSSATEMTGVAAEQAPQVLPPAGKPAPAAPSSPQADVERIVQSARRLGIELDEQEALQWLTKMAVQESQEITLDPGSGVYGAKVAILDFSPKDLEYFRRIGKIVAIEDQPGVVETALALSGSAAQSKIQTNPGDADYFQRVNIKAPTKEEAVKVLADAMRKKGMATLRGPTYQLLSVKFGTFADKAERDGKPIKNGSPMTWYPKDLEAGSFDITLPDGSSKTVRWEDGMQNPGWTKLDWVVADAQRGQLANASNLLDVSWEAPDGEITPLDGMIDPYFQEIYLDASSVPVFSKLFREVSEDAQERYVKDLEYEVYKYLVKHPNYGKVAKRLYNVFRMSGRYPEAAYIRELFDEPTTALYRVWSLFETLSGASTPDSQLDRVAMLKQYDQMIEQVIRSTEGDKELEIVRALMHARDESLGIEPMVQSLDQNFSEPRQDVMDQLNTYFHDLLYGFPPIADYLEQVKQKHYD